ncbi:hypothetical protein AAFC00_000421 [Neodothiora populina]|uniref:tRNA-splicing endonuclease subunit Sen2 n=1 Tax=Neodothiora populina TaxID=2781224 RepID=A0ABR3PCV0_9PEZI
MADPIQPITAVEKPTDSAKPTESKSSIASSGDEPARPPRKRFQKPNYAKIHAKPLPLETYPLPAFIPHSPLSLLRIAATLVRHFFQPPSSHASAPYVGYFSSETRSVHITDPVHVRALWEMGFFGKGTLSRSEPNWLTAEKARLRAGGVGGGGTAEEATRKRREERKMFKLERARLEREQIELQLRQERALAEQLERPGSASTAERQASAEEVSSRTSHSSLSHVFPWQAQYVETTSTSEVQEQDLTTNMQEEIAATAVEETTLAVPAQESTATVTGQEDTSTITKATGKKEKDQALFVPEEPIVDVNQEHLQLSLEEAFFLSYALGVLEIRKGPDMAPITTTDLFTLSWTHSIFPPALDLSTLRADDPFLLNYAVYHHYRSLGWVVRPGVKFSADYMLYNRGPVFSHAEFAVIIVPEYAADAPDAEKKQSRDWWWFHCVNRVQSQVRKSLVICYVEVPTLAAIKAVGKDDIGGILRQYKVREFVLRRWLANRSRD